MYITTAVDYMSSFDCRLYQTNSWCLIIRALSRNIIIHAPMSLYLKIIPLYINIWKTITVWKLELLRAGRRCHVIPSSLLIGHCEYAVMLLDTATRHPFLIPVLYSLIHIVRDYIITFEMYKIRWVKQWQTVSCIRNN